MSAGKIKLKSNKQSTVAMIVMNGVYHDARVLKMATSLSSTHNVLVYGLASKNSPKLNSDQELPFETTLTPLSVDKLVKVKNLLRFLTLTSTIMVVYFATNLLDSANPKTLEITLGELIFYSSTFFFIIIFHRLPAFLKTIFAPFLSVKRVIEFWVSDILRFLFLYIKALEFGRSISEDLQKKGIKISVLHIHDIYTAPVIQFINANKLILDLHELYEHVPKASYFRRRYVRYLQDKYIKFFHQLITINSDIAHEYKNKLKQEPKIIMNASERVKSEKNFIVEKELSNFVKGKKVLLFQGGLSEFRGLEVLIEAVKLFNEDWVAVLIGWGNLEESLKKQIKRNNLQEKILILPPVSQNKLPNYTAIASLGAILYEDNCLNHSFCTPNKIWEYARMGVPIICGKTKTMADMIHDNEIGFSTDLDHEKIALLINDIDEKSLGQLSKNALKFFSKNNWDVEEQKLKMIYNKLGD